MQQLPAQGSPAEQVLSALDEASSADANWQEGRTFSLVFDPGPAGQKLLKAAYNRYFSENGLNPSAFPSLRKFEQECVAATAHLLNGNQDIAGNMTSGGTESLLLAVKTARSWAKATKNIVEPEIIVPVSAHPALHKAGDYFGVKIITCAVDDNFQADLKHMASLITDNTIMLVGSAVQYAQGVVDPIADIAGLAHKNHILCHVDACIGGFMLPFVERLGKTIPPWDFRVQGVTSISCDLHKYAYAAKGASTILYRDKALRRHQYHLYLDWPGGIYASPTMLGTRSGGAMAAAWAMLQYLGEDGYLAIAKQVMQTTDNILNGIATMRHVKVLGQPHMSIIAIAGQGIDSYRLGDELQAKGWHIDRQQHPASLHLTISQGHCGKEEEFLRDLEQASLAVKQSNFASMKVKASVTMASGLSAILPNKAFNSLARTVNQLGTEEILPQRSAAMYGMMEKLSSQGNLDEMVLDALDKLNSLPAHSAAKFNAKE